MGGNLLVISTVANARYHYVSYQSQNFVNLSRVSVTNLIKNRKRVPNLPVS